MRIFVQHFEFISGSSNLQGAKRENSMSQSESAKPIVSAIINMPVAEAI